MRYCGLDRLVSVSLEVTHLCLCGFRVRSFMLVRWPLIGGCFVRYVGYYLML